MTKRGSKRRWRSRALTAETAVLLSMASFAQRYIPMQKWSRILGQHAAVPEQWTNRVMPALRPQAATREEKRTATAIHRACRRLPWEPTCLAQATAGQILLRQFRTAGVVVIGLKFEQTWHAHAWLLGSAGALTGGPAAEGFTPTTVFTVAGQLQAADVELPPLSDRDLSTSDVD